MTATDKSAEAKPVIERDDRDAAARQARVSEKTGSALKPPPVIPLPAKPSAGRSSSSSAASSVGSGTAGADAPQPPLLAKSAADQYRRRLRENLAGFVDSPADAVAGADVLLQEAIDRVAEAMAKRREELSAERTAAGGDTERLRQILLRYRMALEGLVTM
ncbi:hypothetical protein ACPA54_08305 [Uniformispora flossi]|uniref:Uncharacterized protein n=1 Tax=Yinghuangia aomiensis TaxID=676205 RepID=A0ABP9HW87_9ACTN